MLQGNTEGQFAMLWDYCNEMKRTNPGTSVYIHLKPDLDETTTNVFQRFYVCWEALKKGFVAGCRPIMVSHQSDLLTLQGNLEGLKRQEEGKQMSLQRLHSNSVKLVWKWLVEDVGNKATTPGHAKYHKDLQTPLLQPTLVQEEEEEAKEEEEQGAIPPVNYTSRVAVAILCFAW